MKMWVPGFFTILAASAVLGTTAARPLRAQDALPTLVITQPTPTSTPGPSPAAIGLGEDAGAAYVIRAGDTLLSVALEMGVDIDAMGCLVRPDFDEAQPLVIGDMLQPLPPATICHRTEQGDTLYSVAAHYGVEPATILRLGWNGLPGMAQEGDLGLVAGRYLRIPLALEATTNVTSVVGQSGETSPFLTWMLAQAANTSPQEALRRGVARNVDAAGGPVPANWPYGSGRFLWPAYGLLTQGYRFDHRAVDIAAPLGSPVTASDRGVVIRAGWNNQGYGLFVILDHKIDYLTLYAHLDTIFVQEGEIVAPGQLIGTVGATGNSTGPHLHFEIRDFGRIVNPLELLTN